MNKQTRGSICEKKAENIFWKKNIAQKAEEDVPGQRRWTSQYVLDTAQQEWIEEYAVRACTTSDSAYLNHARIAQTI